MNRHFPIGKLSPACSRPNAICHHTPRFDNVTFRPKKR